MTNKNYLLITIVLVVFITLFSFNVQSLLINYLSGSLTSENLTFQGTLCLQETANVSASCGGSSNGTYGDGSGGFYGDGNVKGLWFDGDYGTYATQNIEGSCGFGYVNYTKPLLATNATWQIKDSLSIKNVTIPTDCFNLGDAINLRVQSCSSPGSGSWQCNNATGWTNLSSGDVRFYDEAIYWNNENITRYISLPYSSTVTNAFLNISSFGAVRQEDQNESFANYTGRVDNTPLEAFDANWSSSANTGNGHSVIDANFYENYTLYNFTVGAVNWTFRIGMSNFQTKQNITIFLWNYSDSSWNKVFCLGFTGEGCNVTASLGGSLIVNNSVIVPATSISVGNPLRVNTWFDRTSGGSGFFLYYYEGEVVYSSYVACTNCSNASYPISPYLEVGTPDRTREWNYTGIFNHSNNKTSDFSSSINSYLSSCSVTNNNCSIPLIFHSDSSGSLKYSDIQITYFTSPNVTLDSPLNNSVSSSQKNFTCSVNDFTYLQNITLFVYNSTNATYNQTSINITGYSNSSTTQINFSYSDTFHWNCLSFNNESHSSWASSNYTLIVTTSAPATTLNSPSNNQWLNYKNNVDFNCTIEGGSLGNSFLFGNFTGVYQQNQTKLISGASYNYKVNLSDSAYSWTCGANQTSSDTITPSQNGNFTVNIDTIYPNITINDITTTAGFQSFTFTSTEQDRSLSSCKYSIFNSSNGIDGLNSNTTFTCNSPKLASTSVYGTYNLTIYAVDLASNENSSTLSFTTSASSGGNTGGGGGSSSGSIPVIGLLNAGNVTFNPLQREIIYSTINSYCSNKLRGGALAIADYSNSCSLNADDLPKILDKLKSYSLQTDSNTLSDFLIAYKQQKVFQGYETLETIKKYDLYTSTLGITTILTLTPPSVAVPRIINTQENYTIRYTVRSNLEIVSCEVVSQTPDLSCEITNATIKIKYFIKDTNFLSKVFSGALTIQGIDSEGKKQFRPLSASFVVYNLSFRVLGIPIVFLIPIVLFVIGFLVYKFIKKRRINLKKLW